MTEKTPVQGSAIPYVDGCALIDESLVKDYKFTRDIGDTVTVMTIRLEFPDGGARLKSDDLLDKLKRLEEKPIEEGAGRAFDFNED